MVQIKDAPSYTLTVIFFVARQKLQPNNDHEEMNTEGASCQ
jgi:hypothetical protein